MEKRETYLDNLKVFLTVLVIFHHAGQAYGNGGGWAYTPGNPEEFLPWIWHFFSVNAGFFMGLFFLISGYFVPASYDRQGGRTFVKKKLLRLGVPLLVFGAIFSAMTGTLEVAHMWFVENLLVFCLLYALVRKFCKPVSEDCKSRPTVPGLLILGLVIGIGSYFIRKASPQDNWIMFPIKIEPAHFLQYSVMFVVGILMLGIQHMTDGIWMGAFGKFVFVGVTTTAASYLLTWLLRTIHRAAGSR